MGKKELENDKQKTTVDLIGEQGLPSTNNLKRRHLEGLTKEAKARNTPRINVINEAFDDFLRKVNDVADIDQMDAETRNYWIERDLAIVKARFPLEKCKAMNAYKKAYLYKKLKDKADRERVGSTLGLAKDWDELDLTMDILGKAANRNKDGAVIDYSLPKIANEIRIELSQIQIEFLELMLGQKAVDDIRARAISKFPSLKLDEEADADFPVDEETK